MTASLVPITLLLAQARLLRLPLGLALLVAEMAGEPLVHTYVSLLDPLMIGLCIKKHRSGGLAELKAMILGKMGKVGIPPEQLILIVGAWAATPLAQGGVMRMCLTLALKVRLRVVQNVLLQNVLVGSGLIGTSILTCDSFLEQEPTGLRMASKSWENAINIWEECSGLWALGRPEALVHDY